MVGSKEICFCADLGAGQTNHRTYKDAERCVAGDEQGNAKNESDLDAGGLN